MITHFRQAIEETLPWLSSFGADPAGGMTRLLYSPEWLETQQQFKKICQICDGVIHFNCGHTACFSNVSNRYARNS
mgnify:CR=1 FL=1